VVAEAKTTIRPSFPDRFFDVLNNAGLAVALLIVLYPMIYVVSSSVSSADAVLANRVVLWPVEPTLASYKAILEHGLLMSGYMNSLIYMVGGTTVSVILLLLAAYPLSRPDLPGRPYIMWFFLITMFFNGGMIPNYLLVSKLGMINTRWALIVPFGLSTFNVIVARTFFQHNLPLEILESTRMDGCSDFRFFAQFALPLSKPIIAVMALFHGVGHWNGFFRALLYVSKSELFPLQLVLRDILFVYQLPEEILMNLDDERLHEIINLQELLKYAVIVAGSLPVMLLYPFVQKYFVKGVMVGSIKG
jgi:multiple sugar transport system permease protein/putative aldouronate transport system permease protein